MNVHLSEIFYSIQGEGKTIGQPAIFIRFAGCNLKCSWCDTAYTWHPQKIKAQQVSLEKVIQQIKELSQKHTCHHLIFTGGEPLLQQNIIRAIQTHLPHFFVEIETNGSIPLQVLAHQINISYKLKNSGNNYYDLAIHPHAHTIYKFVIDNEQDIEESLVFCKQKEIPRDQIYFMPLGKTKKELNQKNLFLIEKCKEHGVNFCPRLHIMLWGNQPGK